MSTGGVLKVVEPRNLPLVVGSELWEYFAEVDNEIGQLFV